MISQEIIHESTKFSLLNKIKKENKEVSVIY